MAALMTTSASAQNAMSGATQAQSPIANPTGTIPNFDTKNIGPILNELGITWQAGALENGNPLIAANAGGELIFYMLPSACRGQGATQCAGLSISAIFEGNANPQTVNAFNNRYAFSSAGVDASGSAYIGRYEVADYGTARGNVASSLLNFLSQADKFRAELASAGRTVSLDGYADDLSASYLNRVGVTQMTGVDMRTENLIELHQQGFEEAANEIKKLISDKAAPRNKIDNDLKK
ncbi:MAG: hypothetical protein DHS20C05_04570 [Hyphococcus sp.]|nr:MAG: hypothetical protein DHS20C05_04570 [Marinicaulis sp.]